MIGVQGRRAQITVFIIIAIVILAVFAAFRYRQTVLIETPAPLESTEVDQYLEGCFRKAAVASLLTIEYEGSIRNDIERIPFEGDEVAVLVAGTSIIPSVSEIEQDLADEVLSMYSECHVEEHFPYSIEQDFNGARSTATLGENAVTFTLDVPTTITIGDRSMQSAGNHVTTIATPLKNMLSHARTIASSLVEQPGMAPLDLISEVPFPVFIYPFDDQSMIVRIMDTESGVSMDGTPHAYSFGHTW